MDVINTLALIVDVVVFAKRIEMIASSESLVCTAVGDVPTAFKPYLSKSCAILLLYYKAIAIATANPADIPADPLDAAVTLPFASTVIDEFV